MTTQNPADCDFRSFNHLSFSFQRCETGIDRLLIINPSLTKDVFSSAFKHLDPCGFGQVSELCLCKEEEKKKSRLETEGDVCGQKPPQPLEDLPKEIRLASSVKSLLEAHFYLLLFAVAFLSVLHLLFLGPSAS